MYMQIFKMVRIKFIHSSLLMNYLWYIYAVLALSSWYAAMKPRYTMEIMESYGEHQPLLGPALILPIHLYSVGNPG